MKDKCKKEINDLIDALVNSYESKIEELSTPWKAIEGIESYLSLTGLSFQDLAGVMGYVVVQLDNDKADSEIKLDNDKADSEIKLETVKGSEETVIDVAELTREEIVKLIQDIKPEFTVSIKNTTKQQLIDEYNSLQNKDEVNSTNDIVETEE